MRFLILPVLASIGFGLGALVLAPGLAQQTGAAPASAEVQWGPGCPRAESLRGICGLVSAREEDKSAPGYYDFTYEKNIYAAACVDFTKDTPASAKAKIRKLWSERQDLFKCNSANFDVANGNLLKYAVAVSNSSFIDNAGKRWKVDLNIVDDEDGMTVLDYVNRKLLASKGTPAEQTYRSFRNVLVLYGAKRRSELP